jgi:hypothetical protein
MDNADMLANTRARRFDGMGSAAPAARPDWVEQHPADEWQGKYNDEARAEGYRDAYHRHIVRELVRYWPYGMAMFPGGEAQAKAFLDTWDIGKARLRPRPEYPQGVALSLEDWGPNWKPCESCRSLHYKWWKFCPDCGKPIEKVAGVAPHLLQAPSGPDDIRIEILFDLMGIAKKYRAFLEKVPGCTDPACNQPFCNELRADLKKVDLVLDRCLRGA